MQTVNLTQGSDLWHAHRRQHFNASDAPAMLGCSPHKSRSELLREYAIGIVPEPDAATQSRFDAGHRAEALARPLAEAVIGEDLAPLVGVDGRFSASFDGITLLGDAAFEHKLLNQRLRDAMREGCTGADLPEHYRAQMEHQALVAGSVERILFMASEWNDDGTLIEERHCWYTPDPAQRARLVAGWGQFADDLAAYAPEPPKAAPVVAAPVETLPAVSVRVEGQLAIVSNLPAFGAALQAFIDRIPDQPSTDQEFADTEAACKALKRAEEALEAAESNALAQLADVDTLRRLVADYRALARATRLQREKLVAQRKDQLRTKIVMQAQAAARAHTDALDARLGIKAMPAIAADFAGAIKGKKTLDGIKDACDAVLVNFKIAASEMADRIDGNLKWLRQRQELAWLFPDVLALVQKAPDDLSAIITARIAGHEAQERARLEAERERIRAEEQARARREQEQAAAQAATTTPAANAPLAACLSAPTLRLGEIAQRLGFSLTAEQLRALGIAPAGKDKAAVLFHEEQFPAICDAIARRASQAKADYAQRRAA